MAGLRGARRMALRCSNSLLVALLFALPAAAHAQAYQCRAPQVRAVPQVAPDGPRRNLPVTGYTLALSWSPEFCKPRKDSRAHAVQCSGKNGSFGLVVHGLWPESGQSWPQWCAAKAALTPAVLGAMCMSRPSGWSRGHGRQHGSCMVKRPGQSTSSSPGSCGDPCAIPLRPASAAEDG